MQLVKPSIIRRWITIDPLETIESAGRTCYKSEKKSTEHSAEVFVRMLIERRHFAMLEHASASYKVICDRGVSHEIVRHRLFSYAQESTRYCNYSGGVTFIIPPWLCELKQGSIKSCSDSMLALDFIASNWVGHLLTCEETYQYLLNEDWTPQMARSVLPNALKTEIVITGNLREWRHFFHLRCAKTAHPQMQEIANMLLGDMRKRVGVIFEGLTNGD